MKTTDDNQREITLSQRLIAGSIVAVFAVGLALMCWLGFTFLCLIAENRIRLEHSHSNVSISVWIEAFYLGACENVVSLLLFNPVLLILAALCIYNIKRHCGTLFGYAPASDVTSSTLHTHDHGTEGH